MKMDLSGNDRKVKTMNRRIVLAFYLIFWIFLLMALRLFQVQVVQAKKFSKMAYMEHTEKIPIPAIRGKILDRHGELFAISTIGHSVAAFPQKISHKDSVAAALAPILGMSQHSLLQSLNATGFVWIARKIDLEKSLQIKKMAISGIEVVDEPTGKRFYPKGKMACHVLGYTGIDDQGLDGVELTYDKELHGTPGYLMAETDGLGRVLPGGVEKIERAIPGADITLTIDETIQYLAEKALYEGVKKSHAKSGSIIVMNPENGEILALANVPNFDGNQYTSFPLSSLRDKAVSDNYEPGSTFKGVLAASALDSGKVTREEKFLSGPSIKIGGWTIRNAEDGLSLSSPMQNLDDIIRNSLNVGAASVGLKIGAKTFSDSIEKFGFYRKTGVDLPGESNSFLPDPKTWEPIQLATISFGQGISVTPIQMVTAYATLANGGLPVHPHLVQKITIPGEDGLSPEGHAPEQARGTGPDMSPIIGEKASEDVKELLALVVKKGTGVNAAVPGYTVAGKTGTAQVTERGRYLEGAYTASFIGFVPVEKPVLLILVKVDRPQFPYWGGTVAAPIFQKVAKEALWAMQVPPSEGMRQFGSWKVWGEDDKKKVKASN